jgi:hypothetical protein
MSAMDTMTCMYGGTSIGEPRGMSRPAWCAVAWTSTSGAASCPTGKLETTG